MFLLGILSVLQMTLLPGVAVLATAWYRSTAANVVVAAFALSFALNYAFVTIFVMAGWYTRATLLALIAVEIVAIIVAASRLRIDRGARADRANGAVIVSSIAALAAIAYAAVKWLRSLGTPFQTWDAIHSWNRWARVFAAGMTPLDVQWYPQLIPANWSMSYVLMGKTSNETFAKAPMGVFFLLTLVAIAAAGWRMRSPGILLATPLVALLDRKCVGEFLNDGYVDVPVAFFATASAVVLRCGGRGAGWISCAIAAGAALPKQAGAWYFLVWPVLAITIGSASFRDAMKPWLTAAAAPLAYYAAQALAIYHGVNHSNIGYVTHDIFRGAPIPARAIAAAGSLGIYIVVFAFAIASLTWQTRLARTVMLAIGLPYALVWACWFSYDRRNIALALPFVAIAAADGAVELLGRARLWIAHWRT